MPHAIAWATLSIHLCLAAVAAGSPGVNVRDCGAKGDSTTNDRAAIQKAIDQCAAAGGGEAVVPAGTFLTGTVHLKSNVTLRLTAGAVLQGSYDPTDYPDHDISAHRKFGTITHDGAVVKVMKSLIVADGAENVGIVGEGAIKGAGEGKAFQLGLNKDGKPKNVFMIGCKNVALRGVRVLNAAQIAVSISGCDRVFIDGVHVRSLENWNCDGIDLDARDATVANCVIESEDDALCLKSEYHGRFCENVVVTNCVVASMCNGLKLGTGSRTGFRNVTVSNCVVRKTGVNAFFHPGYENMTPGIVQDERTTSVNCGIVILSVDGGVVENVSFSDIIMTDVLSPIFVRVGRRFLSPDGKPATIRNVAIRNVTANCRSVIPSIVAGLDDSPISDVRLSNIRVMVPLAVSEELFKRFPVELKDNAKGYPENRLTFGFRLPAAAFLVRHVDGIQLADITVTHPASEVRPALYFDGVRGTRVRDVRVNDRAVTDEAWGVRRVNSAAVDFGR